MNDNSDTNWDISYPNKETLRSQIQGVIQGSSATIIWLQLQYEFDR